VLPCGVANAIGREARGAPRELSQRRRVRPGRNGAEHDEDKGKRRQPAQVAPRASRRASGDHHSLSRSCRHDGGKPRINPLMRSLDIHAAGLILGVSTTQLSKARSCCNPSDLHRVRAAYTADDLTSTPPLVVSPAVVAIQNTMFAVCVE